METSNLTRNILIGMVLGIAFGSILHALDLAADNPIHSYLVNGVFDVGGQIFVISLRLMVVPLVFVSLVCGASNLGADAKSMGRIGIKTIGLYLFTTAAAITLGVVVANFVEPGVGVNVATATEYVARESPGFKQVFINIFPSNPFRAMTEGNMLQVIVFAILVGVALTRCGEAGLRVKATLEDWNAIVMEMVKLLMAVAPFGVFCLLITLFSTMGFSAINELIVYFMTVVAVLILHFSITYGGLLKFGAGLSPIGFFKRMSPVMTYAFSTSSSNATLPITLETVEHKLGVKNEIASFTVPLGATINMDGTAIMQGVATVFIAQAFSVDMSMGDYVTVILTATLASIGTAGVPGVGLIMLALVLDQVGLPVEGIALIIGVDRLLDMMRTAVNVAGDGTVSTLVARSEGKFDQATYERSA